jgi:hypothetical protein
MSLKQVLFLIVLGLKSISTVEAMYAPRPQPLKIIDFKLFYPITNFESRYIEKKSKNTLGLEMAYNWYLTNHFGFVFGPGAWIAPVMVDGIRRYFLDAYIQGGVSARLMPGTWLDPTVQTVGAIDYFRLLDRNDMGAKVGARASMNIYSARDPFQDPTLALGLVGSYFYFLRKDYALGRNYLDIGLALRGSF